MPPAEPSAVPDLASRRGSVEEVWRDRWTVTARYDPQRPFYKLAVDDAAGTQLYVSRVTGKIALDTTQ